MPPCLAMAISASCSVLPIPSGCRFPNSPDPATSDGNAFHRSRPRNRSHHTPTEFAPRAGASQGAAVTTIAIAARAPHPNKKSKNPDGHQEAQNGFESFLASSRCPKLPDERRFLEECRGMVCLVVSLVFNFSRRSKPRILDAPDLFDGTMSFRGVLFKMWHIIFT
jgi:hypothetical protein